MTDRTTLATTNAQGIPTHESEVIFETAIEHLRSQPQDGRVCTSSRAWDADAGCFRAEAEIEHPTGHLTQYTFYGADADRFEAANI